MGDVVGLPIISRLDSDPARVIEAALEAGMKAVVVVGYDAEGQEYFASSYADGGDALWVLQRACLRLLRMPDGSSE